jgi:hypothetical protein
MCHVRAFAPETSNHIFDKFITINPQNPHQASHR